MRRCCRLFPAFVALLCIPAAGGAAGNQAGLAIRRFSQNPIIRPEMLPGEDGANINGPSLIRAPSWITNRLGNYYLYFAHHSGKYIRLACADKLDGPWKIHEAGTLKLADAPGCAGHIASPDVHVDESRKEIRMYFHGPARDGSGQKSFVARSSDGLQFKASPEVLGIFYLRVVRWQDEWFAMAKGGLLYRSKDGLTQFEEGHNPLRNNDPGDKNYNSPGPRHVALHLAGDNLWVYYSNIGDAPERILRSRIQLTKDWKDWKASAREEVMRPETAYEGVDLPLKPSVAGAMKGRENAVRDPAIFEDTDRRVYLIYSVAGEAGLAIAELTQTDNQSGRASKQSDAAPRKSLPLPGEVFQVQGHTAFMILPPTKPANGVIPWVWYAPTLSGLPSDAE